MSIVRRLDPCNKKLETFTPPNAVSSSSIVCAFAGAIERAGDTVIKRESRRLNAPVS